MKRRRREVNGRRDRCGRLISASSIVVALVASIALASSCGGPERRADRLWRQAQERVQKNDTEGAIVLMQKIIDDYPDTPVAERARDQIVVYRGLANAVSNYPTRRARELMVQVARAVEAYRKSNGKPPAALDVLPGVPLDPWGHPFRYEPQGRGYRLRCDGGDGAPGGVGDAADLLVVDGEFVTAAP
jgi:hypothetical protein